MNLATFIPGSRQARPPSELPTDHPLADGRTASAPLIRALRGDRPDHLPVWFMRQAGRSLPEYREARQGTGMLEACLRPELAAEITLQPVRRHGVDAGIFFSDIVVPLRIAGVGVEIQPGVGPVMDQPYRTASDVERLTELSVDDDALAPIREAVALCVAELGGTPLIGFGGAPFTLAAYLVEGRPSRDHLAARTLMHAAPETWERLVTWTADLTGTFLRAQAEAGASAVQLFDSWAGSLSLADYRGRVAGASARALSHVSGLVVPGGNDVGAVTGTGAGGASADGSGVSGSGAGADGVPAGGPDATAGIAAGRTPGAGAPAIHFGTGTEHLLGSMRDVLVAAGVADHAVGVDYRTPLDEAAGILPGVPLQGNVDPALLAAPWPVLEAHVRDVVARGAAAPGHVLNLGHGVPPETDPAVLTRVVELAHSL